MKIGTINFPQFAGLRCLMLPYIQGNPDSVPVEYSAYYDIIESVFIEKGDIGYLTIDESTAKKGKPHRGAHARYARALHTEVGKKDGLYGWGPWAGNGEVLVNWDTQVLLANNLDDSCAVWNARHEETSLDGDIGNMADQYPYETAQLMKAGEVYKIGVLTPHESIPVQHDFERQFLRIVSSGVHGRMPYFTDNPLMKRSVKQ